MIQKPNKQELSSLFMTHHLNVMHAHVKFHKYIPYGLGVMAKPNKQELSYLFMTHRPNVMHAPVKFHKYIPYGLGVMAWTRIGTYVRTRRTGVALNALPLFFK